MKRVSKYLLAPLMAMPAVAAIAGLPQGAVAESIPSLVVQAENLAPTRGGLLTPIWVGVHDGTFDSYDGGAAASVPLGGDEIERLAEDGNTGPITETFDALTSGGPQSTLLAPGGPFAPSDRSAHTLQIDPLVDNYFSYASMIIPSNDFFIANGNPLAHQLFDDSGNFVGEDFIVALDGINDAGTEENDELAGNTAFLNQAGPNIGTPENGVVTQAEGFAPAGDLVYPDGVLNHPAVGLADFTAEGYRVARFSFRYVDLGGRVAYNSTLSPDQEIQTAIVDSDARGRAFLVSNDGDRLLVTIAFSRSRLTGPITAAHLHLGQTGVNGPIVLNMDSGIRSSRLIFRADAEDVTGPLAEAADPMLALLNELAAGNIYINLHTAANPAGELRGQVQLRRPGTQGPLFTAR